MLPKPSPAPMTIYETRAVSTQATKACNLAGQQWRFYHCEGGKCPGCCAGGVGGGADKAHALPPLPLFSSKMEPDVAWQSGRRGKEPAEGVALLVPCPGAAPCLGPQLLSSL